MMIHSLSGSWFFRQSGNQEWLPAKVPGCVHTDLLNFQKIPDPFVGDNEKHVQWVAKTDWEYQRQFEPSLELLQQAHIWLVCDGLDTLAKISLNGIEIGKTDNMFRQYRWDVKPLLKPGKNELNIFFYSPVNYISEKQSKRVMPGVSQAIPGGPYLRKAPCQFGWDWGPQLPPIGIWKDIRLEAYTTARLTEVFLQQEHNGEIVSVKVILNLERWSDDLLEAILQITTPQGEILQKGAIISNQDQVKIKIQVPQPQLWMPNGYGNQPLYQAQIFLVKAGEPVEKSLDQRKLQIGLRTIELKQEKDKWGRSFVFAVNGVSIITKGSNWIPADSFPTRLTRKIFEQLILAAAQTNQNMLRVWGGGFYEDEVFYDLCDQYGILVWQDFIFSCSVYPLDDADFVENIRIEVIENIRRLRHRASLALWCGNNEMEQGWVEWGWKGPEYHEMKLAYDQFFHHTLPAWCAMEDPDHAYWPSSPSSGTPFENPNGQLQGDAHYWDVWHSRKPFTAYRNQFPRFMSEFGFQSLPPLETIRTYAEEPDLNMTSYIMEQHQKNDSGNSLMVGQMLDTFRLPKDFESLVYLSMVLQAEGIRYGVEHWRRHPDRVAGIVYWQLNDCWPVASWASLDYFGRWKALHYAARRFFAPLLLSIEDNPPQQSIYVTNDNLQSWEGLASWSLETLSGATIKTGQVYITIPPQSASLVCHLDFSEYVSDQNLRELIFVAELWSENEMVSRQTATFAPIKHLSLTDPVINFSMSQQNNQLIIDLNARFLALMVEVSLDGVDVVFSDNYFNLPAGRNIRISCPLPVTWTLEKAKKVFRLRSIYDTY